MHILVSSQEKQVTFAIFWQNNHEFMQHFKIKITHFKKSAMKKV